MAKADDPNILHNGLVPAQKAYELVTQNVTPIGEEKLPLIKCAGRVVTSDIKALRTQPPFDASAMDGYAVRFEDIGNIPTKLKLIGEASAGHSLEGEVDIGEAARIFTGAPIPKGADTIIIQENTSSNGDMVEVLQSAPKNSFVRKAGLDFSKGETLIKAGTQLNPLNLSLAASMNHAELPVYKKPLVGVLATGDELVLPGEALPDGKIITSNSFGIQTIAAQAGAEVMDGGIASDDFDTLQAKVKTLLNDGADLVVTTGGASVGDHDLAKPVLESLGFQFSFVKVAMRPGKPLIFGKAEIDGKTRRFLGLAGNPVSSLVASYIFLKPLIQLLCGLNPKAIEPIIAKLTQPLPKNGDRQDYMRATIDRIEDGIFYVSAFEKQDSSMLATLNKADCLIIREIDAPEATTGEEVKIIPLKNL